MAKFVLLHDPAGHEICINPDNVTMVSCVPHGQAADRAATAIHFGGEKQMVLEQIDTVVNALYESSL